MPPDRPSQESQEFESLLAIVRQPENARILEQAEIIGRQTDAIRRLETITRMVEMPFVGSYLSV